jgi:hypothetical protein
MSPPKRRARRRIAGEGDHPEGVVEGAQDSTRRNSSATATAGEGDRPKGGGGGAGLNAPQESSSRPNMSARSLLLANRIFRNGNEAQRPAPPPPRFARYASSSGPPPPLRGGGWCKRSRSRDAAASEFWQRTARSVRLQKNKGRQSAGRRKSWAASSDAARALVFSSPACGGGREGARSPFGALPRRSPRPCAEVRSRPRFTRCSAQVLPAPWHRA